ncbi:hypothetical protein Vafri_5820 [Volvox africanus]|nr:hypothetical protein Vafri_5820 [Volvox africanus]
MGQPRAKTRTRRTGEGPCAEDGPPPPFRSWQAPPDGLFDVIVPTLTAKQFVVVQLVCKDWSHCARYCLKDATPKRPDVDLSKLATLYPNLTQLNLSHVEGLSTHMLAPLRKLTALRELCLSNVTLKQNHNDKTNLVEGEAAAAAAAAAAAVAAATAAGAGGVDGVAGGGGGKGGSAAAGVAKATSHPRASNPRAQANARSRPRRATAAATGYGGTGTRLAGQQPSGGQQLRGGAGPSSTRTRVSLGEDADGEATGGSPSVCDSPPMPQPPKTRNTAEGSPAAAAAAKLRTSVAVDRGVVAGDGGSGASCAAAAAAPGVVMPGVGYSGAPLGPVAASPGLSSPLSPASRILRGIGEVLRRLSKLQADLCPALTTDAIACLPNLTDLTLDTLVAPEALAPLGRLRSLAVKKLANPEALERLSGLTALLVNSDSSCASEFLPTCTRLPELQSLTFKTSSTKVLQQPDALCWQGFSRLSSLDLRAPVECLKSGLPAVAELAALRSLSLDLYCASDEELMVAVVAPPNLKSLFVSSDRSRSGGVIDVHPNPSLRALRIRLYWTALNLVLPEGVPEPSPLPEPLSEDLDLEPRGRNPDQDLNSPLGGGPARADTTVVQRHSPAAIAAAEITDAAVAAAARPRQPRRVTDGFDLDLDLKCAHADGVDVGMVAAGRQEPCRTVTAAADACGRGLRRRRRRSDENPSPFSGGGGGGDGQAGQGLGAAAGGNGAAAAAATIHLPEQGPRRRIRRTGDEGAGAAAMFEPPSEGRGAAAAIVPGGGGEGESGGAGGSDGGSSGEEVRYRGAGISGAGGVVNAAAAAPSPAETFTATGDADVSDEDVDSEELEAEAYPHRRCAPMAGGAAGGGGAGGAGATDHNPHASRRQMPSRLTRQELPAADSGGGAAAPGSGSALADDTPCMECRRRRRSAAGGAGVSTPAANNVSATAAQVPEMELQELCLDACFFLLYGSLVPLLRQFPRLRKLTLDNGLALENGELAQLCELSSLQELSLSGLHSVTDAGLRYLGRLTRLTSVRVKGLRKLSVHAAQAFLRQKPIVRRYEEISGAFLTSLVGLSDLRSMALKHLHTIGEGALAAGLGNLKQLTKLEVKDVNSMSDKVLVALTGHTGLKDLSVLHCEGVTSRGRNAVVRALGPRVALDFEGCNLPDITRPCALPTASTQAQLIGDDQVSSSNQQRRSVQHSNQH